jgi:hypothetical protein
MLLNPRRLGFWWTIGLIGFGVLLFGLGVLVSIGKPGFGSALVIAGLLLAIPLLLRMPYPPAPQKRRR